MNRKMLNRIRRFNSLSTGREYREKPSSAKLDKAKEVIRQVLDREIGFAYGQVHRIPLDSGRAIRDEIFKIKQMINSPLFLDSDAQVWKLREQRDALQEKERNHYQYDEVTRRKLMNNFKRIESALELLMSEGEIEYYHIHKDGMFRVRYAHAHEPIEIQVIEQGATFDPIPATATSIEYGDKICVPDLAITYDENEDTGEIRPVQRSGHHGINPLEHEEKSIGKFAPTQAGAGDHRVDNGKKSTAYKHNIIWGKPNNDIVYGFYTRAENIKLRDMNTVNCYA